jgi:hypothetical protein
VSDSQLIHPSGQYALETHPFKRAASLCLLRNPNIEIVANAYFVIFLSFLTQEIVPGF